MTDAPPPKYVPRKYGTKPLGSVTSLMREFNRTVETGEARVPCDGCTVCCRTPSQWANLEPDEADRYEFTTAFPGDPATYRGSTVALAKHEDGSCVYLVDDKCSIYADRPRACRSYDCRMLALLQVSIHPEPVFLESIQQWQAPRTPLPEDRMILLAMRIAMASALETFGGSIGAVMRCMETWRKFLPMAKRALDEPGGREMFRRMLQNGGDQ